MPKNTVSFDGSDKHKAVVRRTCVFLKTKRNGLDAYIRQPYDLVEYDRHHQGTAAAYQGSENTYYQPHMLCRPDQYDKRTIGTDSLTSPDEVYDEITFLDRPDPNAPFRRG